MSTHLNNKMQTLTLNGVNRKVYCKDRIEMEKIKKVTN